VAISLGGSRARGRGARLGARAPSRPGAAFDNVLLGICVVAGVVLVALPDELSDRTAATLRRSAVAPLVELQRLAVVQRAKYLSYDERVAQRAALARDAADVTGLRSENDRLRRILGLGSRLQWGFIAAEAIPTQLASELARKQILLTFMLTQGQRAGVTPFAPVIAPEGLVGMVEQVDPAMSMAITYAHPDFRVSAQTPDGTAFGIVQPHLGTGADRALLEMRGVPFRNPLKAGQLVVSSGQGGTYPRGIPVGTIVREIQTPERWARTYLLQPAVSLGDVGAVLVLRKQRAVAGVDSVWTSVASADSAARRVSAAGDSLARDALLREAAARRAALEAAAAADTTGGARDEDPGTGAAPSTRPPADPGDPAAPPSAPGGAPEPAAGATPGAPAPAAGARPTVPRPSVPAPGTPTAPSGSPAGTPRTAPAPAGPARDRPAGEAPRPTVPGPPPVAVRTLSAPTGAAVVAPVPAGAERRAG
jgi:rod shape-determining protein MreC